MVPPVVDRRRPLSSERRRRVAERVLNAPQSSIFRHQAMEQKETPTPADVAGKPKHLSPGASSDAAQNRYLEDALKELKELRDIYPKYLVDKFSKNFGKCSERVERVEK